MYFCPNCKEKTMVITVNGNKSFSLNCNQCKKIFYVNSIGKYIRKMKGIKII